MLSYICLIIIFHGLLFLPYPCCDFIFQIFLIVVENYYIISIIVSVVLLLPYGLQWLKITLLRVA